MRDIGGVGHQMDVRVARAEALQQRLAGDEDRADLVQQPLLAIKDDARHFRRQVGEFVAAIVTGELFAQCADERLGERIRNPQHRLRKTQPPGERAEARGQPPQVEAVQARIAPQRERNHRRENVDARFHLARPEQLPQLHLAAEDAAQRRPQVARRFDIQHRHRAAEPPHDLLMALPQAVPGTGPQTHEAVAVGARCGGHNRVVAGESFWQRPSRHARQSARPCSRRPATRQPMLLPRTWRSRYGPNTSQ